MFINVFALFLWLHMTDYKNRSDKQSAISIVDEFDDNRIFNRELTEDEVTDLEAKLQSMYVEHVSKQGKTIRVITDHNEYESLRESGELFNGNNYYLFMDKGLTNILDMIPITLHLINTKEGLFYAKYLHLNLATKNLS